MIANLVLLVGLFAQIDPFTGSGGAPGWAGAGLLGLVLSWLLLVHLPAKDKQLREYLEAKDKQMKEALEAKDRLLKEAWESKDVHVKAMAVEFRVSLKLAIDHCKEENEKLIQMWSSHQEKINA